MELQSLRPNRLSRQDLDRLLGGEDSAEVHALLEEWRALSREGDDPLDMLAEALNATFGLPPRTREDILWRASQILEVPVRSTTSRVSRSRRGVSQRHPLRRMVWPTFFGVVTGVLVAVAMWRLSIHQTNPAASSALTTYVTHNGERAEIRLADGTTVVLNVASRLEVPADYAAGHRTVRLVGEGMFTVVHHSGTPLTVLAGANAARVLGTSFVVRHYPSDTTTLVAVYEGKVAVRATVLHAAQQIELSRTGAHIQIASPSASAFATGTLVLDSLSLVDAIPELNRWYDADIRLGNSAMMTRRVTGEFAAGSLSDVIEYLTITLNVRVVRHGRVLTLYPG